MANLNNHNIPNRGCLHSKRGTDMRSIGVAGEGVTRDSKGFKTKGAIKNAAKKLKQIRVKREHKGFG
jgi:hypothetical protein